MTRVSNCCPPSTSPTARPSASSRARPARRPRTATRSTRRSPGRSTGAEWIHLVDLDAAFGRGSNRELLAEVVGRLDVKVELSGGIRDDESLDAALATGCTRVNLGTAALEDPDWCAKAIAEYGDKIAVGLDVRGTTLRGRGWTQDGGELFEVLARLDADGCARYVVTDVTKDGTLPGPEPGAAARRLRASPTGRSSPPAASPRSTTCARSRRWCRWASRARSSARRCTPRRSRWRRRWPPLPPAGLL